MNASKLILTLSIAALPLYVAAQTVNTPGGSASTGTPLDQTKDSPQKTAPSTTATTPDATNPTGKLSKGSKPDRSSTAKSNATATGDVPTYPAPAKDGTPTK